MEHKLIDDEGILIIDTIIEDQAKRTFAIDEECLVVEDSKSVSSEESSPAKLQIQETQNDMEEDFEQSVLNYDYGTAIRRDSVQSEEHSPDFRNKIHL